MDATHFSRILADLIARVPGAYAAVMVDLDGETVDYAGHGDSFDIKLAGAHWQIVLGECLQFTKGARFGLTRTLVVRAERRSFIAHALPEGYSLIVVLRRRAGFSPIHRAFSICERALTHEARWNTRPPPSIPPSSFATHIPEEWFPVDVALNRARRPTRLRATGSTHVVDIEVIGLLRAGAQKPAKLANAANALKLPKSANPTKPDAERPAHGYRVRTHSGMEFTLIREPGGYWYSDADVTNA